MSVVQNPIIGRARGKYSTSVFSKWKNLNILKSKALQVNQPNSDAQLLQRSIFAKAVVYARQLLSIVRFSLKNAAVSMSEFNIVIKQFLNTIDSTTLKIDTSAMANLFFSSGSQLNVLDVDLARVSDTEFEITWESPSGISDDLSVNVIYYIPGHDKFYYAFNVELASFGSASISHPAVTDSEGPFVYVFCNIEDTPLFSGSLYAGQVNY